MRIRKELLLSLFVGVFCSCSKYEKIMEPALKAKLADVNSTPVFDGETEPKIPNNFENNQSILGIDSNKNGIRDDIDIWINRIGLDYNERMAMRQYARAKQFWLKICSNKLINDVMKAEDNLANSSTCLNALSDYQHKKNRYTEKLLDELTLNIGKRDCGDFYKKNSSVVTIVNGGDPHLNCSFKIENLDHVIKSYNQWDRIR